jgi:hypothetical protein
MAEPSAGKKALGENKRPSDSHRQAESWRNPLTLGAGGLFLVHMFLKYGSVWWGGPWPQNGGIDAIALGLATIALLPWITDFLSGAKLPGGIELTFLRRRLILNEAAITQLRFIVEGFLTHDEFQHLKNIRKNVEYEVKRDAAATLAAELRHLRALQLIDGRGIGIFSTSDGKKRRIGDTFKLTDRGSEYLAMREEQEVQQVTVVKSLGTDN